MFRGSKCCSQSRRSTHSSRRCLLRGEDSTAPPVMSECSLSASTAPAARAQLEPRAGSSSAPNPATPPLMVPVSHSSRLLLPHQNRINLQKKRAHGLTLSHWLYTDHLFLLLFSQENLQKLPLSIQHEQENFLISQGHVRNGKAAAHRSEAVLLFTLLERDKKQLLISGSEKKIDFYL